MDINKMTKRQFKKLPVIDDFQDCVPINSIILLPHRKLHDSGYRSYQVVTCWNMQPIGICGKTDILDVFFENKSEIKIDCLRKSKLMRIVLPEVGCELNATYQQIIVKKKKGGDF